MLAGQAVGTVAAGMAAMPGGDGVDLVLGLEPACWSAQQQRLLITAVITATADTMVGRTTTVIPQPMPTTTGMPQPMPATTGMPRIMHTMTNRMTPGITATVARMSVT